MAGVSRGFDMLARKIYENVEVRRKSGADDTLGTEDGDVAHV